MPNNIMPGEWDWMYGQQPQVNPGMGFPAAQPATQPGFMQKLQAALGGSQGMLNFGASLLAASGPSSQRTSLGQALGGSLLANQQFQQQSGEDALKTLLLKSQIAKNSRATTTQTNAQKDYEYAKANGFQGTFEEWKRVASAQQQTPADILSFNDFMSRSPEVQQKWIDFKRNSQPYQVVDVGGGRELLNKSTGSHDVITTAEQEAAGAGQVAAATAGGKTTGEAVASTKLSLPTVEQNTHQARDTIAQLKKHPGLPYITGAYSKAPVLPGTAQAGADALAQQIQGSVFLQAYESLRGAQGITDVEGRKAEAAKARLQRAQTRREYIHALDELDEVLQSGLDNVRRRANTGAQPRSREDILNQYLK